MSKGSWQARLGSFNLLGLLVATVALYAYFTWRLPRSFLTFPNIETIAVQATVTSMAALGMTLIIVVGAIDLSIGSTVALTTVVIALALQNHPAWVALLYGVGAGTAAGLVNGLLITRLRVMPFIVTLGTMQVVRGIARGLGHDSTVDAPKTWLNEILTAVSKKEQWKLFPPGVWFMIGMAVLVGLLLWRTVFGRNVVAVGSNEQAARVSGVNSQNVKLGAFVIAGLLTGLAGLMQFSRLKVGDPTVAAGLELDVIAAVVIGGGSLNGGQGSVIGAVIGAIFMTTMGNGFAQIGLPEWVQYIVKGAIIVLAVALDRVRASGE